MRAFHLRDTVMTVLGELGFEASEIEQIRQAGEIGGKPSNILQGAY